MEKSCCVILAAGEGKRMKSSIPKVLSPVLFEPMVGWVINSVINSKVSNICVVTGYRHELVEKLRFGHYPDGMPWPVAGELKKQREGQDKISHALHLQDKDRIFAHVTEAFLPAAGMP